MALYHIEDYHWEINPGTHFYSVHSEPGNTAVQDGEEHSLILLLTMMDRSLMSSSEDTRAFLPPQFQVWSMQCRSGWTGFNFSSNWEQYEASIYITLDYYTASLCLPQDPCTKQWRTSAILNSNLLRDTTHPMQLMKKGSYGERDHMIV